MKNFSSGTLHPCYRQNKRHLNYLLRGLFCSGVSQRRAARLLRLDRRTITRKFLFLCGQAEIRFQDQNASQPPAENVQFDELETFEHTKCKPLAIALAVEKKTRRILGLELSSMPTKGPLAKLARARYGSRSDERRSGRERLFQNLLTKVSRRPVFESDRHPLYPGELKKILPHAEHIAHKGRRGSIVGQGELKKVRFDPLFSLNHTCAMNRANINRLFRRTWCTTKKKDRLKAHLYLYADYHNSELI